MNKLHQALEVILMKKNKDYRNFKILINLDLFNY